MELNSARDTLLLTALERMGPHDHLCSIYESPEEHFAVAMPFIRIGLDRGEKCIYIADDGTEEVVRDAMLAEGIDVERAIETDRLVLKKKEAAYLKHGSFDPECMFTFWKDATDEAMSQGFPALRATGETEWVLGGAPGLERWIEYESRLADVLAQHNCFALCQYNRHLFPAELILEVIRTHPTVVYRGAVCRNMYRVPPDELLGKNQAEREVERLLTNIRKRERADEVLRESEARFRQIAENIREVFWVKEIAGDRVAFVSPMYEELFGRSCASLYANSHSFLDAIHIDDRARMEAAMLRSRAGMPTDNRYRVLRPDGTMRWVRDRSFPVPEATGPIKRMVGVAEDITEAQHHLEEIRLAEAALRSSEGERARLDSITDAALSYLGLDALLRELLGRLRSALRAELASVWLVDEESQVLVLRAVDGVPLERIADVRIPLDSSKPITLDAPFVVNDLQPPPGGSDNWYARVWSAVGLPLRTGMGVPLLVEAKAIGVLTVASTLTPFTEEDQRLLQVVADRAAPAIERERLVETVVKSRRRLAALSQRLVEVQETERREIARELHDEVGQFLTGLLFKIERNGAGVGNQKDEMKGIVNDLIDRVRELSMNLRPSMLDDLGLLSALKWQIRRFKAQTGICVRFHHAYLDRRFGAKVEITAFRIVQEALTNVARHAGVKHAKVYVWASAVSLGVRIEDAGRGFDVEAALAARASGLEGMRERSRLAGGHLAIESEPGQGTRLSVELPLDEASEEIAERPERASSD
jgi:PAS domain S-box-containing protein